MFSQSYLAIQPEITIFNKIAIQRIKYQMVDHEANYYLYMCIYPLWDICQFLFILKLLAFTQSVDDLLHSFTVLCVTGCLPRS